MGRKIQNPPPSAIGPAGTKRTHSSRGDLQGMRASRAGSRISTKLGQQVSLTNFLRARRLGLQLEKEKTIQKVR